MVAVHAVLEAIAAAPQPPPLAEGLWTVLTFVHHEAAAAGCNNACAVFSEWEVETAIDASGAVQDDPLCRALALLLKPCTTAAPLTLTIHAPLAAGQQAREQESCAGLAAFARAIDICATGGAFAS